MNRLALSRTSGFSARSQQSPQDGGSEELPAPGSYVLVTTDFTDAAKAEVGVLNDYGKPQDILGSLALGPADGV